MKTRLLPVLLLTAAFPFAAVAQDTGTPPGTTPETTPGTTDTTPGVTPPTDDTNSTTDPGGTAPSTQPDTTSPAATPAPSADDASPTTDSAAPTDQSASTTSGETFVTVPETGAWRVSDLQGKAVYGSEGSNIGKINDVLVSQNGAVNAVIIGVGGFLGIGQKDVAVNISALQLGPGDTQAKADAVSSSIPSTTGDATGPTGAVTDDSATPGQDTTAMGGAGIAADQPAANPDVAANTSDTAKIGEDALPDRIILNVTREELERAPAFEGVRAP